MIVHEPHAWEYFLEIRIVHFEAINVRKLHLRGYSILILVHILTFSDHKPELFDKILILSLSRETDHITRTSLEYTATA